MPATSAINDYEVAVDMAAAFVNRVVRGPEFALLYGLGSRGRRPDRLRFNPRIPNEFTYLLAAPLIASLAAYYPSSVKDDLGRVAERVKRLIEALAAVPQISPCTVVRLGQLARVGGYNNARLAEEARNAAAILRLMEAARLFKEVDEFR